MDVACAPRKDADKSEEGSEDNERAWTYGDSNSSQSKKDASEK